MKFIFAIALLLFSQNSFAVKIQFPEDELAAESVVPKFDNPVPVMNRNIITAGKLELSAFLGWTLNDVFVDPMTFGGTVTYHLNEIHALQFYGSVFSASENDYPAQIDNQTGVTIGVSVPKATYILAYQITPYYGKLSFTKQNVVNMSFYGTFGLGTYQIDDDSTMAISAGLGSKVYFNEDWNLRIDYRFFSFNGKEPYVNLDNSESYSERQQLNSILTAGVGYVF